MFEKGRSNACSVCARIARQPQQRAMMQVRPGTPMLLGVVLLVAAGCSSDVGGSDATLAKMDGWHEERAGAPFALLEIAYGAEAARTMWDENVTADLPVREGKPREPGIYGDFRSVDFAEQVVALFSSGQSGSCPSWVRGIETDHDGTVAVTLAEDAPGSDCTADYNPYRVLIVIDRDDVPTADALSTAHGVVDGNEALEIVIGEYPLTL